MKRQASDVELADPEWADLLGQQLESLCEVAEQLTYRVLELEERLARQECVLGAHSARNSCHRIDHAVEQRLRRTEHRLALLKGGLPHQDVAPS